MSFPAGYSDPNDKTVYGSAFGTPIAELKDTQYTGTQQQINKDSRYSVIKPQYDSKATTVIYQPQSIGPNEVIMFGKKFSPNSPTTNETPIRMQCPSCNSQITTNAVYETGSCTWIWCIILGVSGALPVCFLPFFFNCTKDVVHTCPRCKAVCGKFDRKENEHRVKVHGTFSNALESSEGPFEMQCPSCEEQITTIISHRSGACAWYWCMSIGGSGLIPFCFIPFCTNCSKDIIHRCPRCKAECGRYYRNFHCCRGAPPPQYR